MAEIFLSWKFLFWVVVPIVFKCGGDFLERYRPQLFAKHRRNLIIAMIVYFFLAIAIPGMIFLYAPKKEQTTLPVATHGLEATIQEEQAAKDFFKEPPAPKKGQGAGFPDFAK
ncbi:hypothetical protein [Pelosinus propionicus]|uniref:Uncharacterized protein n=1 Tax=Pelosinus propionicus DSM 13327 TaxID=1123291 RepID=A0A1I4HQ79_9FIRM|nr:hypothetical protein [Pelosinus propionicus]SFL43910.1 hypothetical protein SAMN04490355_1004146 [Pelosinus propionicus DSM 13327]